MKIKSLRISNILSFKYSARIEDAEELTFDDGLNIIIGENGAGKSTALEVINFLFKRVLYKQYQVNQDLYSRKSTITIDESRSILAPANHNSFAGFRLDPSWDNEEKAQTIRIDLKLDEVDTKNIELLKAANVKLIKSAGLYATKIPTAPTENQEIYVINITLNQRNRSYAVTVQGGEADFGYEYLTEYNFYKEAITLHNFDNPNDPIDSLYESFTLISSYRNYHAFEKSISLRDQHPTQQIQDIKTRDYSKSLNTSDTNEPSIFGLVRLRVAEKHFSLISDRYNEKDCEDKANSLPFIVSINTRLKLVNLECKIKLIDLRTWQYSFEFHDLRRNKVIGDINSLSAGQKAIIHLVFEAYGRGNIKGGVIVIDEPEIHLHYQFQNEYVQVIRELNKDQNCQYILVTHSEALINSSTINNVRRFSLNRDGYTEIRAPRLTADQRTLIKILDNTRSTYAFFAKKVVLVEGDTDRYFFKSIIQQKYPTFDQEIAVLYMGGKNGYKDWSNLFMSFGLSVYCISDFDFVIDCFYPNERGAPLRSHQEIQAFKTRNPDWEARIDAEYRKNLYILKQGNLESYLQIRKGLKETIDFCNDHLTKFITDINDTRSKEIVTIMEKVVV